MRASRALVWIAIAWTLGASDVEKLVPLRSFDIRAALPESYHTLSFTIAHFVSRSTGLYFVVASVTGTSVVLRTDLAGAYQGLLTLPPEPIQGFDTDAAGQVYILSGNFRGQTLRVFSPQGTLQKTITTDRVVSGMAVVDEVPLAIRDDNSLGPLDTTNHAAPWYTVEAWGRPFNLFSSPAGILLLTGSQPGEYHIMDTRSGDSSHGLFAAGSAAGFAAAVDALGDVYLLHTRGDPALALLSHLDREGVLRQMQSLELPSNPAFLRPLSLGIAEGRIYVADLLGKVAVYPVTVSATSPDRAPTLVWRTQAHPEYTEEALRAGLAGNARVSLAIDDAGIPRNARLMQPVGFGMDEKVLEAVRKWRFRPAIRDGKPVTAVAEIEIVLQAPTLQPQASAHLP